MGISNIVAATYRHITRTVTTIVAICGIRICIGACRAVCARIKVSRFSGDRCDLFCAVGRIRHASGFKRSIARTSSVGICNVTARVHIFCAATAPCCAVTIRWGCAVDLAASPWTRFSVAVTLGYTTGTTRAVWIAVRATFRIIVVVQIVICGSRRTCLRLGTVGWRTVAYYCAVVPLCIGTGTRTACAQFTFGTARLHGRGIFVAEFCEFTNTIAL